MSRPYRAYLDALKDLMNEFEVPHATLLQGVAGPDDEITARTLGKLCERAIALTSDSLLGLRYGIRLNVNTHGIVGYALMSSRTAGRAVDLLLKYNTLLAPGLHVVREDVADKCRIECSPRRENDLSRFFVEAFIASLVVSTRFLLGHRAKDVRVEFSAPEPETAPIYLQILGVPVSFGQRANALVFDVETLDAELPSANPVMSEVCEQHCEQLLRSLNWHHGLAGQVRERLLNSPADFPSVSEMAQSLSMSERTLRRRLRAEDTGFQEILNEIRGHLAKEYLKSTDLPVADIAVLLGFDESANFRRAFKQWTGQPPGAYRKNELRPN